MPSKFVLLSLYFSSFRSTFWNHYTRILMDCLEIWTLLEHIRACLQFNFSSSRIKKSRVIIDFWNFQVRSFVIRQFKLPEHRFAARLNIVKVPFCGLKKNWLKNSRNMKQNPTLVKIVQSIFTCWKIKSFCHYQSDYIKEWIKNCYGSGLVIVESFYQKERRNGSAITEFCNQMQPLIENVRSKYSVTLQLDSSHPAHSSAAYI